MAGKINKKSINDKIFNNRVVKQKLTEIVNIEIEKQKLILLSDFAAHPVTQELQAAENATNISSTLGGYGNLFSFIGFFKGTDPISPVLALLNTISLKKNGVKFSNGVYQFKISVPSKEELGAVTRMPWEAGRSWLFDMEKTISGLGSYLYAASEASRSGTGIQTKNKSFSRSFRGVKYFNTMYNKFLKKIK